VGPRAGLDTEARGKILSPLPKTAVIKIKKLPLVLYECETWPLILMEEITQIESV
jgi:hypothetical protein